MFTIHIPKVKNELHKKMTINLKNAVTNRKKPEQLSQEMIAEVDCNGDGIIDFCEFLKMMSRHSNPGVDPEQQLAEVFRLFDKDRSGYITQVSVVIK